MQQRALFYTVRCSCSMTGKYRFSVLAQLGVAQLIAVLSNVTTH